ncbi:TIGR04282 family arsenosugar biosynthesis glycosyltransferase [Maribacter sp. X9]|uniref:TIGR04282 family arsenosugar biosynthesis glycosyltransferase n=1 Tax=Maribacter sp. X9 TaxID=3402159 RepID=UPI003AF398DF
MKIANHTAILVFANSAKKELEYKPIGKGEQLFDALTESTLQKVQRTYLPVFHFTEEEQVGANFGERFTNAIASVFEKGFENIITIGNDTPQLTVQHLKKAAEQLAQEKTVIGPSLDGGFYLLGLKKSNFDIEVFKDLPWQRFDLFSKIALWFQNEASEIVKLPVFQDLDDEQDLKSALRFSKSLSSEVLQLIITVLGHLRQLITHNYLFFDLYLHKSLYNKGSPRVFFA